jgi:hypothetical protein
MNEQLAMRLAKECRIIIQACLREEEWLDAEEEFRWVILAGLKELQSPSEQPPACAAYPVEHGHKFSGSSGLIGVPSARRE